MKSLPKFLLYVFTFSCFLFLCALVVSMFWVSPEFKQKCYELQGQMLSTNSLSRLNGLCYVPVKSGVGLGVCDEKYVAFVADRKEISVADPGTATLPEGWHCIIELEDKFIKHTKLEYSF